MNFLDRFRYSYDSLKELNLSKVENTNKTNFNNPILKSLLSTSVKVTPEIFPKIDQSIKNVFSKLELNNNFNFFITANHTQSQASCAMMPESNSAEIIIIATNHHEFKEIISDINQSGSKIVYDVWSMFDDNDFPKMKYYRFGRGFS